MYLYSHAPYTPSCSTNWHVIHIQTDLWNGSSFKVTLANSILYFLLSQSSFIYLLIFGVECNCCTWSQLHTLGRTPLDEWSARRRDIWQHTTLTRDRHPCPRGGFEPAIPTSERPQTHASDAPTGIGHFKLAYLFLFIYLHNNFNITAKLYISAVCVGAHMEHLLKRLPQQCSCLHPNLKATTVTFKL